MNPYFAEVNRIEFAVTYQCNSHCKHCHTIPQKGFYPKHVDRKIATEIVRKVGSEYHPTSIMTFGGEPLLFPDLVCAIHNEARAVGIPSRQIITNGNWAKSPERIRRIADDLRTSGVNSILFSVDSFHQDIIPIEIVRTAARSCLKAEIPDIRWNPCWAVSEESDNRYDRKTRFLLERLSDLGIPSTNGNALKPGGSAQKYLKEFMPRRQKVPLGRCGEMPYTGPLDEIRNLFVQPDGTITICNEMPIGNACKQDIISLIEEYNPYIDPIKKALIEGGTGGLVEHMSKKNVLSDPRGYYSPCDLCVDMRRRSKRDNDM